MENKQRIVHRFIIVIHIPFRFVLLRGACLTNSTTASNPCGIGHGHIGQNLAVQFDVGLIQSGDELAVAQACTRTAALMRMIHSRRKSRLRLRRSRKA